MYSIDYLVNEHEEIKKFVSRVEDECLGLLNGKEVDENFFRASIEFIRKYADGVHHKKEEDILFKYMVENLGTLADKLVRSGMLVEHQLARGYCLELENNLNKHMDTRDDLSKLQIIANAMGYVNLLRIHIEKENGVVYPFAEKNLEDNIKDKIENETKNFIETESDNKEEKDKLLSIIFN